jgi:hypothetical protein
MALANGQLAFYRMPGTKSGVSVRLEGETVWLTLDQMATLFQRDKSVISRHLRNVYQNRELDRKATVAKNATVLPGAPANLDSRRIVAEEAKGRRSV